MILTEEKTRKRSKLKNKSTKSRQNEEDTEQQWQILKASNLEPRKEELKTAKYKIQY